jgi:hypothetical protein
MTIKFVWWVHSITDFEEADGGIMSRRRNRIRTRIKNRLWKE